MVNVRRGVAAFVVGLGLLWCVGSAQAAPVIELYTMGQGDDLFARFGHTAVCVLEDAQAEDGLCYNYGTTDFTKPISVGWGFLRGQGQFWVSVTTPQTMLRRYIAMDRSVWQQTLPEEGDDQAFVAAGGHPEGAQDQNDHD